MARKNYTKQFVSRKFCCEHILLVILKTKKLLEHFTKKNYKKQIKKCFSLKSDQMINYMLNEKDTIIPLTAG